MVDALVIGDIHLSGQNLFESQLAVNDIVKEAGKRPFDMVVFLGDICDKFQNVHVSVLRVMCNMVHDIKNTARTANGDDVPIFFITGNHDRPNNQHYLTDEHPFHGISDIVTVVATCVVEHHLKGIKFLFAPYVPDGRLIEAIHDSGLSVDDTTCLFAHQTVRGAPLASCISETGDVWEEDMPLVISGHIHGYVAVQPNWLYAGMAWQQHPHDSSDRAILHCHFGQSPGNDWVKTNELVWHKRIQLSSVPKKMRIDMTCEDLKKYIPPANTYVQIRLSGTTEEIQTVLKLTRVRNFPDTVRIVINRLVDRDAFIPVPTQSFASLVSDSIANNHPQLLEYHKEITKRVKDAQSF